MLIASDTTVLTVLGLLFQAVRGDHISGIVVHFFLYRKIRFFIDHIHSFSDKRVYRAFSLYMPIINDSLPHFKGQTM